MKSTLQITVSQRQKTSFLQSSFVMPPFKVANITEDKQHGQLHLMLMSSSPGILDGDEYDIDIIIHDGASLLLQSQSYQRIFPAEHGAKQSMKITVGEGASFIYLPHPSVPHRASIFKSSNQVFLQKNARLIWGEIITCGRLRENEIFQFSSYHSTSSFYRNDKLLVRENLLLEPQKVQLQGLGQLEGYTHQASLIVLDEHAKLVDMKEIVLKYLEKQENITFGISSTPAPGLVLRMLGYKGEQLFNCLQQIANIFSNKFSLIPS